MEEIAGQRPRACAQSTHALCKHRLPGTLVCSLAWALSRPWCLEGLWWFQYMDMKSWPWVIKLISSLKAGGGQVGLKASAL